MPKILLSILLCFSIISCKSDPPVNEDDSSAQPDATLEQIVEELPLQNIDTLDWPRLRSLENYFAELPKNVTIEIMEFSWPADEVLCDLYQESDGPLYFALYRIKETGQIIYAYESGAYCQGDSEYYRHWMLDLEGNVVHEYYGHIYAPDIAVFYEDGKAAIKVEFPAFSEAPSEPLEPPVLSQLDRTESMTATHLENRIQEYLEKVKLRKEKLEGLPHNDANARQALFEMYGEEALEEKASWIFERDRLVKEMDSILRAYQAYSPTGLEIRKPIKLANASRGESLMVTKLNVPVYQSPSSDSRIISSTSYYDPTLFLVEEGPKETIPPFGTHHWYKVKKYYDRSEPSFEGWIYGAFVAKGLY